MIRRPPRSPLFPYTTPLPISVVFVHGINGSSADFAVMIRRLVADGWPADRLFAIDFPNPRFGCNIDNAALLRDRRSEEHTSELQSQSNLVCRLLLEKKKKKRE